MPTARFAVRWTVALVGVAAMAAAAAPSDARKSVLVDGVAAHVNTHVITVGDVLDLIDPVLIQVYRRYEGDELRRREREVFKNGLDALIEKFLILDAMDRQKVQLPDWMVEDEIRRTLNDRFAGNREALYQQLVAENLTYDDWRRQVREQLILSLARESKLKVRSWPSPAEVEAAYGQSTDQYVTPESVKLRMLVLQKKGTPDEVAIRVKQCGSVRDQIVAGADFAELAKKLSEGPGAENGGDQGWMELGALRKELRDAAAGLAVNDLSPVIETADELYLIRVEARKHATRRPLEEVREGIEKRLRQDAYDRLRGSWIERLKKDAYVKVFDLDPAEVKE